MAKISKTMVIAAVTYSGHYYVQKTKMLRMVDRRYEGIYALLSNLQTIE